MNDVHSIAGRIQAKKRRRRTKDDKFLESNEMKVQRQKKIFNKPSSITSIIIVGCFIFFQLIAEKSLNRKILFVKRNEITHHNQVGDDFHPNKAIHTMGIPLSYHEESNKDLENYSNDTIASRMPSPKAPSVVWSGILFQSLPSATNLLLQFQTVTKHLCYKHEHDNIINTSSVEDRSYSDSNYYLRVVGGGTCNQFGFGSFPRHSSKNVIVTAYYEIPSKHPPNKYREWMGNFLSVYEDPMVIFTSPDLVSVLIDLRRRRNSKNREDTSDDASSPYFDTIIVALPLEELPLAKFYPKLFWVDQLNRDPQSNIHSPLRGDPRMRGKYESGELYWIWLSKTWFVAEATKILGVNTRLEDPNDSASGSESTSKSERRINENTYDHNVFAWIDIGSFRKEDKKLKDSNSSLLLLRHTEIVPATEMLFWSHSSAQKIILSDPATKSNCTNDYSPNPHPKSPYFDDKTLGGGKYFFHSGAHFAGRPRSIQKFFRQFLHTIDVFVQRNLTLADDQAVMQSTCLSYFENTENSDSMAQPQNLCAYATRNMASGKSKWFGLSKLLQTGFDKRDRLNCGIGNSTVSTDSYWRPPSPLYYLEFKN